LAGRRVAKDAVRKTAAPEDACGERGATGRRPRFRVKTLGPVLWRKTGADLPLRVVVIAPLGYRLPKGSMILYRKPCYLLYTDPDLPHEELLQSFLWRWRIEVNFREEKSLLDTGEAQVRTEPSNKHLPAMTVAAYAMLWIAALQTLSEGEALSCLQPPKWRNRLQGTRQLPSTGDLLRLLRVEPWAGALRPTVSCTSRTIPRLTRTRRNSPPVSPVLSSAPPEPEAAHESLADPRPPTPPQGPNSRRFAEQIITSLNSHRIGSPNAVRVGGPAIPQRERQGR